MKRKKRKYSNHSQTNFTNKELISYPIAGYGMSVGLEPLKKTAVEGALSMIFAATSAQESGQYICPPAVVEPGSEKSQDEQLGNDLMGLTRIIVKSKTNRDLGY